MMNLVLIQSQKMQINKLVIQVVKYLLEEMMIMKILHYPVALVVVEIVGK